MEFLDFAKESQSWSPLTIAYPVGRQLAFRDLSTVKSEQKMWFLPQEETPRTITAMACRSSQKDTILATASCEDEGSELSLNFFELQKGQDGLP